MSKNFLKKLQNFIFQEKLLKQNDKILVGISGGSDSIGLALALKKLQNKYKIGLFLVHINYHQRGEDSDRDEQFVRDFAEKNNLELKVVQYEEASKSGNSEENMRNFRYQKFFEIKKRIDFNKIAVAHHQGDQAETFFMNLFRGSGLQGLTGMASNRNSIIRPFLIFSKKEIKDFLEENDQEYRTDKTNLNSDFTRNKIRLELIPYLEKNFDSLIVEKLNKLMLNLQDENAIISFWAEEAFENLIGKKNKVEFIWDISKLDKLPLGGKKRLFREILFQLKGDLKNVSNNNFLEFKKIIDSKKSKKQKMQIGDILLIKDKNCVIFKKVI